MHKPDLTLNYSQDLVCHKKTTNQQNDCENDWLLLNRNTNLKLYKWVWIIDIIYEYLKPNIAFRQKIIIKSLQLSMYFQQCSGMVSLFHSISIYVCYLMPNLSF